MAIRNLGSEEDGFLNSLYNSRLASIIFTLVLFVFPSIPGEVLGISHTYDLDNGINVDLYTAEEIISEMTERSYDGSLIFRVDDGLSYKLIEDINDPDIVSRGDGSFHPHEEDAIMRALREVDLAESIVEIDVKVYLLPYPRRGLMFSSACGERIFISPGVFIPSPGISAYLVTHELGHCVQNKYLPLEDTENWNEYLGIRGILGDSDYGFNACHCNDPVEIFAEDFRYLFGGELSNYSGGIENQLLPLPDMVNGLEEFLVALVGKQRSDEPVEKMFAAGESFRASNYPNPFNPSTTIRAVFDEEFYRSKPDVDIGVYDVSGRLVDTIFSGSLTSGVLEVRWNGKTSRGDEAGSGVYFYRIRADQAVQTGKMMMVR